jgi:flagellar protein FliO/FliZ
MSPVPAASPLSIGSLVQLTLSLALIVGLIVGLSWLLKRLRVAGPRSNGAMVILDQLAVSPRDRIVLVGIGAAQVLVGVGAGGVVALAPLDHPLLAAPSDGPAPAGAAGSFAEKMRELLARQGRGA